MHIELLSLLTDPSAWFAFLTLTALEIALGVDNIVFIAILADRLPPDDRMRAWRLGLAGALIIRLALLMTLKALLGLEATLVAIAGHDISGRDLIMLGGGLFLLAKSAHEIYVKVERVEDEEPPTGGASSLWAVVAQIAVLDIVFSLDSVITAVGIVDELPIMVAAVIAAVAVMLAFAKRIDRFVSSNPSVQVLALSFLLLVGSLLVGEAFDQHIDKGYVYFAMAFSMGVEVLHIRARKRRGAAIAG